MISLSLNPFPALTTERLLLRQLKVEDAAGIHALRSSPEVNRYLKRQASQSIEDALSFIAKIDEVIEKKEGIYWVITLASSGSFAGTICLFNFSEADSKCEIGYELLPQFQGQGIMFEAAKAVVGYARNACKIRLIEAYTHKDNAGSTKLLKKLDFENAAKVDIENPDYCVFTLIF